MTGQAPEEEIVQEDSESKPTTAPEPSNAGPGLNVTVKGGYQVKMTEITVQNSSGIKKTLPLARQSAFTALLFSVMHVANGDPRGGTRESPKITYYRSPEVYFAKNLTTKDMFRADAGGRATSTRAHAWSSSRGPVWSSSRSGARGFPRTPRRGFGNAGLVPPLVKVARTSVFVSFFAKESRGMKVCGIDVGISHLAIAQIESTDGSSFLIHELRLVNVCDYTHNVVPKSECKLHHTSELADRMNHFQQEHGHLLDGCDLVAVERQPIQGLQAVQLFLYDRWREEGRSRPVPTPST